MSKTTDEYFELYRQKLQEIDNRKEIISAIRTSAETKIKNEADAIKQLDSELRYMQKVITSLVETGKDLTEILLVESDDNTLKITMWDHDNPFTSDIQTEYVDQQISDFSHQIKILSRVY